MGKSMVSLRARYVGEFSYAFADRVEAVIEASRLDHDTCRTFVWQYSPHALPFGDLDPVYNRTYPRKQGERVSLAYNSLLHTVLIFADDTLNPKEIYTALVAATKLLGENKWDK